MREWKVMFNGKLYSDRFDEEWLARCHIEEEVAKGVGEEWQFAIEEMTQEEIAVYE